MSEGSQRIYWEANLEAESGCSELVLRWKLNLWDWKSGRVLRPWRAAQHTPPNHRHRRRHPGSSPSTQHLRWRCHRPWFKKPKQG